MRFRGLDLNLIYALDILLEELSVSRTAERLHLSQPAVSSALSRLREYFKDDLLVSVGRQMIPTAYAHSLQPVVKEFLGNAQRLVATTSSFDPETSRRHFRISASDYLVTVLLTPFLRRIENRAQNISIDVLPTGSVALEKLERGEVDLILTPRQYALEHHPSEVLFSDRHVVLAWEENRFLREGLDVERFLQLDHIAVGVGVEQEQTFAERELMAYRDRRRIAVKVPIFSAVPWMLQGTQRIAVLHESLARVLSSALPLRIHQLPFEFPPMTEVVQWHETRMGDAGIQWLVEELKATFVEEHGKPDKI